MATPSKTYPASCHCGAVSFTVTVSPPLDDPAQAVVHCNCSICTRNGYLFVFCPGSSIRFDKGEGDMTEYTFGPKRLAHYFCPTCGTSCFAQSTDPSAFGDVRGVNVRTFHDVDLNALKLKEMDGKSM